MAENRGSPSEEGDPEVARLCQLLLGTDRQKLREALERIENRGAFTRHVSKVLGDAMWISAREDEKFGKALAPAISEGVHTTVKRDPGTFGEALAPAMGPAIRQAVLQTFRGLVETFENTLEQSFSPRGWKWRIEAWRTGKPLTEVIFMHTLAFRVEHVFLIHRETSLLLQQASRGVASRDPDLISAMLTAIQDFVSDAFESPSGDRLDSFRVGDLTVWIEDSPHAILAGVIRGQPLNRVRLVFRSALETINLQFGDDLESFDGDTQAFAASLPELEACLQEKLVDGERAKKSGPSAATRSFLLAGVGALIVAFVLWRVQEARQADRWQRFVAALEAQPGIMITVAETSGDGYRIVGLRDPLAGDPRTLVADPPIDPRTVTFAWTPIHSLEPEIVRRRCIEALAPPDGVQLAVTDERVLRIQGLEAAGATGREWHRSLRTWWEEHSAGLRGLGIARIDTVSPAAPGLPGSPKK